MWGDCWRSRGVGALDGSNVLNCYQNIDLQEKLLQADLETLEKGFRLAVTHCDDFELDDVIDEFDAAVFPASLIRSGQRTDGERAKPGNQLFANLFYLLRRPYHRCTSTVSK